MNYYEGIEQNVDATDLYRRTIVSMAVLKRVPNFCKFMQALNPEITDYQIVWFLNLMPLLEWKALIDLESLTTPEDLTEQGIEDAKRVLLRAKKVWEDHLAEEKRLADEAEKVQESLKPEEDTGRYDPIITENPKEE